MVYEIFFRKPFSKTRVRLPLDSFHSHLVFAVSLFLTVYSLSSLSALFSSLSWATKPPLTILSRPQHPGLISASFFSFSAHFLSRPAHAQPTRPDRATPSSTVSSIAPRTDPTVAPSHNLCPASIYFSQGNPHRRTAWSDLIWSDQIWSHFFFFFSFDIWDLLIFFGKLNDIWELFIIVNTILHSKLNFFYYNLMHFICSFIR